MANKPPTNETTKPTKPKRQAYPPDHVIRLLVKDNPKREGTKAHLKFSLFKDGMTVMAFQEAARKHEELKGRLSLRYDVQHDLIAVEAPKG